MVGLVWGGIRIRIGGVVMATDMVIGMATILGIVMVTALQVIVRQDSRDQSFIMLIGIEQVDQVEVEM